MLFVYGLSVVQGKSSGSEASALSNQNFRSLLRPKAIR